ncbi:MAG: ATP-dependent helicase, partial [Planctomycetota bacterium]|nr:ATP-dependent helicase [Planctomycetota bacterium]
MIPPLDPRADAWPHGPRSLVLIGPPGTGKTTALLGTWLAPALEAGVPPHRILACSFTKAAAGELAHRLAHKVGVDPEDLERTCCTIHSEAWGRVRMVDPGLRVRGDDREQLQPDDADGEQASGLRAAAKLVWDYVRSTLTGQGLPIRERVEEVCDSHFATDRRIVQYTPAQLTSEIEDYEQAKRERHELDFTDMLELALRVEPRELELLVVDEAQDLSPLQWTLVSRWFERAKTVVLCGDPDQAIHTWCGADPAPLPWYARHADWTARRLAKSYRVPRSAHRLARGLILQDPERMDAPYAPADRDGLVEEVSRLDAVSALERAAAAGRPRPGEPRALVL